MTERFDIYFSGQILTGQDPGQVRQRIANIFGSNGDMVERLFSGATLRVKAGVDQETAVRYRVAFRDAGALVDIRPVAQTQAATPAPGEAESNTSALTLLPPRTGSLIDCAPQVQPAAIPDISNLVLAPVGSVLAESKTEPAPSINTDGMKLSPARSGTLEDCQIPVEPAPIPDISALRLDGE